MSLNPAAAAAARSCSRCDATPACGAAPPVAALWAGPSLGHHAAGLAHCFGLIAGGEGGLPGVLMEAALPTSVTTTPLPSSHAHTHAPSGNQACPACLPFFIPFFPSVFPPLPRWRSCSSMRFTSKGSGRGSLTSEPAAPAGAATAAGAAIAAAGNVACCCCCCYWPIKLLGGAHHQRRSSSSRGQQ